MKIVLINPPTGFSYNPELSISYPLGLMYIAATLEEKGLAVKIIDFVSDQNVRHIEKVIAKNNADIFGISVITDNRSMAFSIVNIIRRIHRNSRIVLGGIHPTLFYKQILNTIDVDAIFLGESELSFLRYVTEFNVAKNDLLNIPGVAFRDASGKIITTKSAWVECIDKIPKPAFHLIELDRYKNSVNEIDFHMLTSRGCPFRCNFCSISAAYKGHYRVHSVSRVIEEMMIIQSFKSQGRIMFHDDFFAVDTDRTRELCKGIIKKKIILKWTARFRVDRVDSATLRLMKESGCEAIFFGIETGSPKILEAMNKQFSFEDVKRAFALTKESGIKTICNIMLGYPGEDKDTLRETRDLLSIIKPDKVYFHPVVILPGTVLYNQCVEKGLIDDSFWIDPKNKVPLYDAGVGHIRIYWNVFKMRVLLGDSFTAKIAIICKVFFREAALLYMKLFCEKGK